MKNALLIERDATTRRSLELALALRGYLTATATGARRLRELTIGRAFDLVIVGQPAEGYDSPAAICRAVRDLPRLADAKLLVLDSGDNRDAIVEALRAGANGYLTRPIDAAQLGVRLDDLERRLVTPEAPASPSSATPAPPVESRADRYRVLVEQTFVLTLIVEADGTILWANPAAQRVLGHDPEQLPGRSTLALCHPDDVSSLAVMLDVASGSGETVVRDLRFMRADGTTVDLELRVENLRDNPAVGGVVLLGYDVSERVQRERALRGQLLHDSLTGLPNRLMFVDQAERTLARADRRNEPVVMVFIDLDDMQEVNLRHGAAAVDELLRAVAARLHNSLRANDTTSRFGDDEFAILLDDIASEGDVVVVAERLLEQLARPFEIADVAGNATIVLTGSMGVAVSRPGEAAARGEGESRLSDLLRRADAALSRAKASGKARWVHADELGNGHSVTRNA